MTVLKYWDPVSSSFLPLGIPGAGVQPGGTPGQVLVKASAADYATAWADNPPANNVGRNKLHNSMFRIQQRGAGPWTVANTYMADRWILSFSLDTVSAAIGNITDIVRTAIGDEEATFYLGFTITGNAGAAAYSQFLQRIEDVRRLANKTITVSFWAQGGSALNLGVLLSQIFGSGGSPSAPVTLPAQTVALTTSWQRYSVTFTLPSISGKTLGTNNDHYTQLNLAFSSGATNSPALGVGVQSGSFSFWGMQLEIGSNPTPLEKLDIVLDMAECMRFYQLGSVNMGFDSSSAGAGFNHAIRIPLVVPMRATPTYTTTVNSSTNSTGNNVTQAGTIFCQVNSVPTAAGMWSWLGSFTASADL